MARGPVSDDGPWLADGLGGLLEQDGLGGLMAPSGACWLMNSAALKRAPCGASCLVDSATKERSLRRLVADELGSGDACWLMDPPTLSRPG